MSTETPKPPAPRTAVLVVHGMGSQRPQETVHGVVDAVWRDKPENKVWMHPEPSGTDLDLTVMTTSAISDENPRRFDFHELYWAHLIAETRAMAVLLWAFELAKRGPHLRPGMRPIWWGAAIYLVFLILSISFLATQLVQQLAHVEAERVSMMITPVLTGFIIALLCAGAALWFQANRLATQAAKATVITGGLLLGFWAWMSCAPASAQFVATHLLPAVFAYVVTWLLMGKWAKWTFLWAYAISVLFHLLKPAVVGDLRAYRQLWVWPADPSAIAEFIPWSLISTWSTVAAWLFIASYFVVSAWFLQPYIGDVARYLRNSPANVAGRREIRKNAVDLLVRLHESGKYDRIIVVAHSLGTVVAYDMLRATFARMRHDIPLDPAQYGEPFAKINEGKFKGVELRPLARELMRRIYARATNPPEGGTAERPPKPWLVTDFVTLGSPLTHAIYLRCQGNNEDELIDDFYHRVADREVPLCPPQKADGDKVLTFTDSTKALRFHHAALFGLTRWTNLYFPRTEIFWGDAIGGPVGTHLKRDFTKVPLFGDAVVDVEVSKRRSGAADFFTHTAYWDVERGTERPDDDPPHILALKLAVNLSDADDVNDPSNFARIEGIKLGSSLSV